MPGSPAANSPRTTRGSSQQGGHFAQLYEHDSYLCESVAGFVAEGVGAGEPVIVVATREHQRGIIEQLEDLGLHVAPLIEKGDLTILDARTTLAGLLVGERPDAQRFETQVASLLEGASGRHVRPVRMYGEMVDLLWANRQPGVAMQLEMLWIDFVKRSPIPIKLMCSYNLHNVAQDVHGGHFQEICHQHDRVNPTESYAHLRSESKRASEVSRMQQRARALEGDVAQRRQLEWALRDALEARSIAEEAARASRAELSKQVDGLTRLHEMSLALSQTRDLRKLLDGVLAAATAVSDTDIGIISLYDEIEGWLEVGASLGFSEQALAHIGHIEAGAGACGMALKERRRVIVDDVETDPLFTPFVWLARDVGFRAVHSTPLIARDGDVLGVLTVHYREVRHPSEREQHLIDVCARQAVDLIENARLYARLRAQDRRKDEFLDTVARELQRPLEPLAHAVQQLHTVEGRDAACDVIEHEVHQISRLVEDLTDLSRFAARRAETPAAMTVSPRVGASGSRRILVVDDHVDGAETIALFARYHGHEARVVHDGAEAVALALEFRPDVVLLDLELPTLSGYDVARAIRREPWATNVTIVAVSAWGRASDREQSREAGFNQHLVKPVDHNELARVLQQTAKV